MKPYLLTVLIVLGVIGIIDWAAGTRLYRRKRFWQFMGVVVVLTVVVDGYFAGLPTEIFNPEVMSGVKIWRAPVENILFGIAMMWLNVILFELFKAIGKKI